MDSGNCGLGPGTKGLYYRWGEADFIAGIKSCSGCLGTVVLIWVVQGGAVGRIMEVIRESGGGRRKPSAP